jgi:hypothetical protein
MNYEWDATAFNKKLIAIVARSALLTFCDLIPFALIKRRFHQS